MGLDRLGILFIIIILPIALVLNTYTNTQVDTLKMQLEYDTKLNNSTYDAVKTYQINSLNEDASNLGDVRIGNVNAAINVFFTSLASNLNMSGYSRQFLQEYVPAIVFTMYDGYYIYSKYTNTLDDADYATKEELMDDNNGISEGEPGYLYPSHYYGEHPEDDKNVSQQLYGLKPFIHYSCRYKQGNMYDFVVSYTLDNYVTIQGTVNGKPVDRSGYLVDITSSSGTYERENKVYYKNIEIEKETILADYLVLEKEDGSKSETESYKYHKVNGVKYYYDADKGYWFSMLNGIKNYSTYKFDEYFDESAYNYYKKAIDFSTWLESELRGANASTINDVVDEYDVVVEENGTTKTKKITGNIKDIFNFSKIEEPDSKFNEHRREVIKYTIEKNLSIAIANYNSYSGAPQGLDFRMPEFNEQEWDRIQQNMTVISYLQGLPIGTKLYNGVSVIANNVNEEVVSEQSIYIGDSSNSNYYPVTYKDYSSINNPIGIYNVDLQRRQVEYNKKTYYYYPKLYYDVYSLENQTVNLNAEKLDALNGDYNYNGNLYKYLEHITDINDSNNKGTQLAKTFYTALGRERESRYNQRNNYEKLLNRKTDEELEIDSFNARFKKELYGGNGKTADELSELISIALENNKNETDINNRIVIRQGDKPSKDSHYVSGNRDDGSVDITQQCVDELNDWTTSSFNGKNYVVATMGANTSNGYKGDLSPQSGKKYNINYYYFNGKLKGIYVSRPY